MSTPPPFARVLLRAAAAGQPPADEPLPLDTTRILALRMLLDEAVLLFDAHGLQCAAPMLGHNVCTWSFEGGRRVLEVELVRGPQGPMRTRLRSPLPKDHAGGAVTSPPVDLPPCRLLWDPLERRWCGPSGEPGLDCLVAYLLDGLR